VFAILVGGGLFVKRRVFEFDVVILEDETGGFDVWFVLVCRVGFLVSGFIVSFWW